jgi:CHAD domain-containing protein
MPRSPARGLRPHDDDGADLREHLASHVAALAAALPYLAEVEPVHDVRVRARRLRSLLRSHRVFLPAAVGERRIRAVLDDLRWLGRVVGAVRDVDVLAEHLALVDVDDDVRRAWLADLQTARATALGWANHRLAGARARRLLKRLQKLIDPGIWPGSVRPTPDLVLPGQRLRVLVRAERALTLPQGGAEEVEAWHDVRKAAKELRYAAEAFAGHDPAATRWADASRKLQVVLGRQLDREGVASWLEAFASRHAAGSSLAAASRARAKAERRLASRRDDQARQAAVARVRDLGSAGTL